MAQVARKKGTIGPGGIPNIEETARTVIRDYMNGKLTYFTTPPEINDGDEDDSEDDQAMEEDESNEDEEDDNMEDSDKWPL